MKDYIAYLFFLFMPTINWAIAGWWFGHYCQERYGIPYTAGVLIWTGINLAFTAVGCFIMTRRSRRP